MEEFKDIKSYEGLYKVNRQGEVYSYITNKKIKGSIDSNGYRQMHLSKNGEYKKKSLHRIVAEAFLPNPNNLPEVNHKDGNKLNNSVDNLEWCSSSYNHVHAFENGLHSKEYMYSPVRILLNDEWIEFKSMDDCAIFLGVKNQDIYKRLSGRRNNPSKKGKLKGIYFERII